MTRYARNHQADDPLSGNSEREKNVFELHDEEIQKAKDEIAALVEQARALQYARAVGDKPENELVTELQALFKQVHKLNAKWLASRGYEYEAPPFVPYVPGLPGEPWGPAQPEPAPVPVPAEGL